MNNLCMTMGRIARQQSRPARIDQFPRQHLAARNDDGMDDRAWIMPLVWACMISGAAVLGWIAATAF